MNGVIALLKLFGWALAALFIVAVAEIAYTNRVADRKNRRVR